MRAQKRLDQPVRVSRLPCCSFSLSPLLVNIFFFTELEGKCIDFSMHGQENDPETAETLGWLPLVSLIVFIAGFAIGFGPLAWLLMSELVPEKVRIVQRRRVAASESVSKVAIAERKKDQLLLNVILLNR